MDAGERYRELVEARCRPGSDRALGRIVADAYLHNASLHVPGGVLVYSREEIARYFRADQSAPPSPAAAVDASAPRVIDVFAARVHQGTLVAARAFTGDSPNRTPSLSMALMRGPRINEEWLFEIGPRAHDGREPARVMLDLGLPSVRAASGRRGAELPSRGRDFCTPDVPTGAKALMEAFHGACVFDQFDGWLSRYVDTPTLHGAGLSSLVSGRASLLACYRELWGRFEDRRWYAERVVTSADGRHAAMLWRLTGARVDGADSLGAGLPGLTFLSLAGDGRIERDHTLWDDAALRRDHAARAFAWKP